MYVEMKNIYKRYGDFLASDNVRFQGLKKENWSRFSDLPEAEKRHFY